MSHENQKNAYMNLVDKLRELDEKLKNTGINSANIQNFLSKMNSEESDKFNSNIEKNGKEIFDSKDKLNDKYNNEYKNNLDNNYDDEYDDESDDNSNDESDDELNDESNDELNDELDDENYEKLEQEKLKLKEELKKNRQNLINKFSSSSLENVTDLYTKNKNEFMDYTYEEETMLVNIARTSVRKAYAIAQKINDVSYLSKFNPITFNYFYQLCNYNSPLLIAEIERFKDSPDFISLFGNLIPNILIILLKKKSPSGFLKLVDILNSCNKLNNLFSVPSIEDYHVQNMIPILYLIQNMGQNITLTVSFNQVIKDLFDKEYMASNIKNVINCLINVDSLYLLTQIYHLCTPNSKQYIANEIINNSDLFYDNTMKPLISQACILNPDLLKKYNLNRLFYIIRNSNEDNLKQLLKSRNFKQEEYVFISENGENCFHFCLRHKPTLLPILVQSDYFDRKLLSQKNNNNKTVKDILLWNINNDGKSFNTFKEILKIYYPEPEYVNDDFEGESLCTICCASRKNICLIGCGHTLCSNCIENLKTFECPYCNAKIEDIVKFNLHT